MYCFKCGAQIPDESVFCSICGTKVGSHESVSAEPSPQAEAKFKLTIDRTSQVYLINPPIKILIDTDIRLSVDNGQTSDVMLPPGPHHLEFTSSMRTTKLDINLEKDTVIQLNFSRLSGKIITKIV